MYAFKIVTTTFNIIMMAIFIYYMWETYHRKEKESMLGFWVLHVLFVMNMFCMWY